MASPSARPSARPRPSPKKIEEARERARESLTKASAGINPIEQRQRDMAEQELQRQAAEAQARDTLAAAIDRYLEQYARQRMRPDYFKETNRALEVDVAKVLGARPIRDLTRREIRDLLGAIVARTCQPRARISARDVKLGCPRGVGRDQPGRRNLRPGPAQA